MLAGAPIEHGEEPSIDTNVDSLRRQDAGWQHHRAYAAKRLLLDTHAFLWWLADSDRLSCAARDAITDESNDIVVSAASAWEIATRFRIGKLPGCEVIALDVAGHIARQGFAELEIGIADAERAGRLPGPHRDPFDRVLAAQALVRDLPVVSVDPVFDGFGVRRVW